MLVRLQNCQVRRSQDAEGISTLSYYCIIQIERKILWEKRKKANKEKWEKERETWWWIRGGMEASRVQSVFATASQTFFFLFLPSFDSSSTLFGFSLVLSGSCSFFHFLYDYFLTVSCTRYDYSQWKPKMINGSVGLWRFAAGGISRRANYRVYIWPEKEWENCRSRETLRRDLNAILTLRSTLSLSLCVFFRPLFSTSAILCFAVWYYTIKKEEILKIKRRDKAREKALRILYNVICALHKESV